MGGQGREAGVLKQKSKNPKCFLTSIEAYFETCGLTEK